MYKISSEPLNKIAGAKTVETEATTAREALNIAEGLEMSDERVTIISEAEGEIDLDFLRILAKEEKKK